MDREFDVETAKTNGHDSNRENDQENQQDRLIIDSDQPDQSGAGADQSRDQINGTDQDEDADDVIGAVLHMVDVADDDLRRLSSRSSASSISPQSLPVTTTNGSNDSGRRSQNASPDDHSNQNGGGSSVDEDLVNSPVLTVACGYLTAKLHMDRFYCPGIHQLCIEYNGQFLTPKQFTIVAAKDKQKDWKGAIKINRQPVRILFERNMLDFYKHGEYCSGRCVSKSYKPLGNEPSAVASSSTTTAGAIPTTNGVEFIQQANAAFLNVDPALAIGRAAAEMAAFANGFMVKNEMDDDEDEEDHPVHQQPFGRRRASAGNSSDIASLFRNAANGLDLTTAVHGSPSLMQTGKG